MDNNGRLYGQVAAEAGVSVETAMTACYLANLAKEGRTLDQAAALLRKGRADARDYARDWRISFADYTTSPKPLTLIWQKEKRGLWRLDVGGEPIATATANGALGYKAQSFSGDAATTGSDAEIAIRRLSIMLERQSLSLFGVDDVVITMDGNDGLSQVAPKQADNSAKLASALAA